MRNRSSESGGRSRRERIDLSEIDGVRYLHFGTVWIQGAMRINRPFALELDYQRQMMAPLLFLPRPAHIVQLGLGAGALTKFCWRHLESSRINVVEISPRVVATARRWFCLPGDGERLTVTIADAGAYVRDPRRRRGADWLQVDLYDAGARGPVYDDAGFYSACRGLLRSPGVAAFNLFGRGFEPGYRTIAEAFGGRALVLPQADAGNRIVLAFRGPRLRLTWEALRQAAATVQARLRLPAMAWARGLWHEQGLDEGGDACSGVLRV